MDRGRSSAARPAMKHGPSIPNGKSHHHFVSARAETLSCVLVRQDRHRPHDRADRIAH
jgi:hypothetical protein